MHELILKITLAHLIGDFVLQSNKMVADIAKNKLISKSFYLHIGIHLLLVLLMTKFNGHYIVPALLLALSHLIIDLITKIALKEKISSILNLLLDQSLHFICIAIFIYYFYKYQIDFELIFNSKTYLMTIAIIFNSFVAAIVIKKIMEAFDFPYPNNGIKDAGKYIGILERLFVFLFVISSFWEGIGFLLAAKSIFRFGDLKENKEIKLTEYILIGTLLSFGFAIAIGWIYLLFANII